MKKLILFLLGVDLLFLYLFFKSGYFLGAGWFFGGVFLILLAYLWQGILNKIIVFGKNFWVRFGLAFSPVILLLSFFSSAFIVFYKLSNTIIWWTYFLSAVFTIIFWCLSEKNKRLPKTFYKLELGLFPNTISNKTPKFWLRLQENFFSMLWHNKKLFFSSRSKFRNFINESVFGNNPRKQLFKKRWWFITLYLVGWIFGMILLFQSKTGEVLQTPWQAISPWFLIVFFLLTFLAGIITFSRFKVGKVLFILILHSFLLHSYLPMAHTNPWGGDVWRHLAIEQKLVNEEQILPVLVGENVEWKEVAGVDIPVVFTAPQKYSYGQMWGLNIVFAKTFGFKLNTLHIWLTPVLWSFFVPLLLFFIGSYLFRSRCFALLLVWLSFLPFPFQALGALTLPVSLGFISFLFTLLLLVLYFGEDKRIKSKNKNLQKMLAIFFGVSMIFSYSLYLFVLFLLVFAILIFKKFKNNIAKIILLFSGILFLPIIEIISKTSVWPKSFNFVESLTQFVGQFSGWYFARAIRPHDILSGNIFFNHTPELAFVGSIFTNWRWYIPIVLLVLWGTATFGFIKKFKTKIVNEFTILFLSISIFGSYIIGWFFLEGDRQLVRRLDLLLAFSVLLLFIFGASYLLQNKKVKPYIILIFLAVFSFFATTNLASGPDMRVVSENEYKMAEKVWSQVEGENYCVIADTWILLPLEAISSREIIGGGFPIDYQFGQSELAEIHNGLKNGENEELLKRAFELTNAETCFMVKEYENGRLGLEVKILEKNVK
ncbi:MAG: hypothetical protein L3J07_02290 [Candidatus Magasanikbacteria bacterium]|nr:hypothetical protein [Candidatus Magasanikbacteria bacterium]